MEQVHYPTDRIGGPRDRTLAAVLGLAALGAMTACDPLVPPGYTGQTLFTMSGSVTIDSGRDRGPLRPAIAFYNPQAHEFHMTDVDVEGEFPSDFTIRLRQPPPAAALLGRDEGPRFAIGYLAAVTPAHPPLIALPRGQAAGGPSGCPVPDADGSCEFVEQWCAWDGDVEVPPECYEERRDCPAIDSPPQECTLISTQGDPSLKQPDPFSHFAGLAEDYALLYLPVAVDSEEADAIMRGLPALDQGYHLVSLHELSVDELEAAASCRHAITLDALAAYNDDNGADHTYEGLYGGGDCTAFAPCVAALGPDSDPVLYDAIYRLALPMARSAQCPVDDVVLVVAERAEAEHISVRIGPDVQPNF